MRIQVSGLQKFLFGFVVVTLPAQGQAELIMSRRIIRLRVDGRPELRNRPVHVAGAEQSFS